MSAKTILNQFEQNFKKRCECRARKIDLKKTVKKASDDGLDITFSGEYASPYCSINVIPFVVAQTPEQEARLCDGIVDARLYNFDGYIPVIGRINSIFLEFIEAETEYDIPKQSLLEYEANSKGDGFYTGIWKYEYRAREIAGSFILSRCRSSRI